MQRKCACGGTWSLVLAVILSAVFITVPSAGVLGAGGHDSAGVSSTARTWYLAEGSTGGTFQTWVLVMNPGKEKANVHLTYMTTEGSVEGPSAQIEGGRRKTFRVNDTLPNTDSVSTRVDSNIGVVAERAVYWGGATDAVQDALQHMTLEQKVGQLFCIGFDGTAMGPEVEGLIRTVSPGGVILFSRNVSDAGQVGALDAQLQALSMEVSGQPLFIATDQEGGRIRRITWTDDSVSQANVTTPKQAYDIGLKRGQALKDLGINLNLAPVLDSGVAGDFLTGYERCFTGGPDRISSLAGSMISGQKAGGILSTAKHFPGYGGITFDPENDHIAVVDQLPQYSQFKQVAKAQPEFVMAVASAIYTPLDANLAFTLSPVGISLLRKTISGNYLVITDDLGTKTLKETYTLKGAVTQAFKAGVDVLLVCHSPDPLEAFGHMVDAVRSGEISETQLDQRVLKILQMKGRLPAQ
jgi:beta-glucosidase-like glycosyl hydrolase